MNEKSSVNIPKEGYKIRIYREDFNFSAGHISVYQNHPETLHGHNYQVSIELSGELDDDFVLLDFRHVKKNLKSICSSLNHRVLVPILNSELNISKKEDIIKITMISDNTYLELPATNVLCLPLPNISSEMLAHYIFNEFYKNLQNIERINKLSVEIEESNGQSVIFEREIGKGDDLL